MNAGWDASQTFRSLCVMTVFGVALYVLEIKIGHPFGALALVVLSNVLYVDVLDVCKIIRMKCPYPKK